MAPDDIYMYMYKVVWPSHWTTCLCGAGFLARAVPMDDLMDARVGARCRLSAASSTRRSCTRADWVMRRSCTRAAGWMDARAPPSTVVCMITLQTVTLKLTLTPKLLAQSLASAALAPFLGAYSKKVSPALTVEQIERVTIDGVAIGDVSQTASELLTSHTHTIELEVPAALLELPPLPSWEAVETQLNASPGADTIALWRARHTFAATLAHALRRLPSSHRPPTSGGRGVDGRWCVWVVGAVEELEGQCARHGLLAEALAVLYPHTPGWQLELIGPGMGTWELELTGTPATVRTHTAIGLHSDDRMPLCPQALGPASRRTSCAPTPASCSTPYRRSATSQT